MAYPVLKNGVRETKLDSPKNLWLTLKIVCRKWSHLRNYLPSVWPDKKLPRSSELKLQLDAMGYTDACFRVLAHLTDALDDWARVMERVVR